MPLEKQMLPIPFLRGINTGVDDKILSNDQLITLQNGRFDKYGAINKRQGFDPLTTTGLPADLDLNTIVSYKDAVYTFSPDDSFVYNSGVTEWSTVRDSFRRVDIKGRRQVSGVARPGRTWEPGVAYAQDYFLVHYQIANADINFELYHRDTNALTWKTNLDVDAAHVVTVNSRYIFAVYISASNMSVFVEDTNSVDTTAPTAVSNIRTDVLSGTSLFDVTPDDGADTVWVAYEDTSNDIRLVEVNTSGTVVTNTNQANNPQDALGCYKHPDDDGIFVVTSTASGNVRVYRYDDGGASWGSATIATGLTTLEQATAVKKDSTAVWVLTQHAVTGTTPGYTRIGEVSSAPAAVDDHYNLSDLGIASKGVFYDSSPFICLNHESATEPGDFLVEIVDFNGGELDLLSETLYGLPILAAVLQPDLSNGNRSESSHLPFMSTIAAGHFMTCLETRDGFVKNASGTTYLRGYRVVEVDLRADTAMSKAFSNGTALLSGGFPGVLDGDWQELTPVIAPVIVSTDASGSGNTYNYRAIYEWTDRAGNVHRSAQSASFQVTATNTPDTTNITVTISELSLSVQPDKVFIVLYRTEASGTVFYRVGSTQTDVITQTATILDNLSDTVLATNETLYTTGGVLEAHLPPPVHDIVAGNDRVWVIDAIDRKQVWPSKIVTAGVAPEFNQSLKIPVIESRDDLESIGVLDDKIVLFSSSEIFVIAGAGPNNLGQQDTFIGPERVTSNVGCIDRRSLVSMPLGLMFKSDKGIYLLDRSLQAQYVGEPVETYNSDDITSAVLVTDLNEVRFTLDVATQSAGLWLVYNYERNEWGVYTGQKTIDSVYHDNDHYYADESAVLQGVFQEQADFLDDGAFVKLLIRTAWLKVAGITGFQRIWRVHFLGTYKSAHGLSINLYRDYDSVADSFSFTEAEVLAFDRHQWSIKPSKQKAQAISIEFQDTTPVSLGTGEGMSVNGVQLELGIKKGAIKLPATMQG